MYEFDCNFWHAESNKRYIDRAYMILPFELMDHLVDDPADVQTIPEGSLLHRDRQSWGGRFSPPVENLHEFAPTSLWGDAAPFSKKDSLYLLLWSGMAPNSPRGRFWCAAFAKSTVCACCGGKHTFNCVLEVLVWCYQVWMTGIFPTHRHDGVPFAA